MDSCASCSSLRPRRAALVLLTLLLSQLALPAAARESFGPEDVQLWLQRPGVKLVAVDFYATWCAPCNSELPRWKKLLEQYWDRGLRLVVVSVQSACAISDPRLGPDQKVCDDEGQIATEWKLQGRDGQLSLPQSFLWSWDGGQLASHARLETIEQQVERYFATLPRIEVSAPLMLGKAKLSAGQAASLRERVQAELLRQTRLEVMLDREGRGRAAQSLREGSGDSFAEGQQCQVGRWIPANARLEVKVAQEGLGGTLYLYLVPLERACIAGAGTAVFGRGGPESAAVEAVAKLVEALGLGAGGADRPEAARVVVPVNPASRVDGTMTSPGTAPPPPDIAPAQPRISGGEVTAAHGILSVEIKPYGQVRLDLTDPAGKSQAVGSPYRNERAAVGTWRLLARAQGHDQHDQNIAVLADETTLLKLELKPLGALEVVGSPAGAEVKVNGPGGFEDRRGLPWSAQGLSSGSYQVAVSRAGYRPFSRQAEVEPGRTTRVEVVLEKEQTVSTDPHGITWVALPGGTFQMGSTDGGADEQPVHRVTLSPFQIMKSEVTARMYQACVEAGVCGEYRVNGYEWGNKPFTVTSSCNYRQTERQDHPMNCVSHDQAKTFAAWAGSGARLCSEAEWEYAVRGSVDRTWPWGNQPPRASSPLYGNFADEAARRQFPTWNRIEGYDDGFGQTSPVCHFPAGHTPEGICDLAGNVWEWVADRYSTDHRGAPGNGSARLTSDRPEFVGRGGSWGHHDPASFRASSRAKSEPQYRDSILGFRLCR